MLVAVYLVTTRVMLAPIFNFSHPATASYEGDVRAFIWVLAWDNHALLDRVPSLFDANKLYPMKDALAYGEHLYGISLFTLPIYALTRNPVLAYNIVWLLSYVLMAAAMHWLAWRCTRDHLAAFVAAIAGTFCFFRMHHGHGHLNLIWTFWIPLSFIAIERWMRRPAWPRFALVAAIVVLQALASWYQAILIGVADGLLVAWLLAAERRALFESSACRTIPGWLGRMALQCAAGAAAAIAIIWPFARHYFILHAETPAFIAGESADLAGWLIPPENTFAGQWLLAHHISGPRWIWGEVTVYLGWMTLALAVVGAIVAWRSRDAAIRRSRFFIVLAVVSAALALGPTSREAASGVWGWSPFGLLARVPGLSLFRVPARYSELLTIALAVLAASACAAAHRRFGHRARAATIAAVCVMLCEYYVVKFPGGPPQPFPIPLVYKYVATLPPGALLSVPDYAATPLWFEEANYQYFSTAHWHPIVNGDSREWPAWFRDLKARFLMFPDASAASAMRNAGVKYVVLHADQPGAAGVLDRAAASSAFRVLARFGHDYIFDVLPSTVTGDARR